MHSRIINHKRPERGVRIQYERPVILKRNEICNQRSRKAAHFISRTTKFQNAAVRFFGICALRAGSSSLIFDGRLSSTPPSSGDFIGTTLGERVRWNGRGGAIRKRG
jgi:hypothetical protein